VAGSLPIPGKPAGEGVLVVERLAHRHSTNLDEAATGDPGTETGVCHLLVEVVVVLGLAWGDSLQGLATVSDSFGSPAEIGELFLTDHLLAFEITSIVLLVAAIGGVVLGTTPEKEGT